ncbi:MAG TPA: hypothetical protein VK968_14145 [Roseimicrobium sp.]|nr:hypothetical protein [Roseimicrobium sp.]
MYKLATLSKPVEGGIARIETWIRSEVAIEGKVLHKLKDTETGAIRSGWTVESVANAERPEHILISRSHRHDHLSKRCDL